MAVNRFAPLRALTGALLAILLAVTWAGHAASQDASSPDAERTQTELAVAAELHERGRALMDPRPDRLGGKAEVLFDWAFDIRERILGPGHADTLESLFWRDRAMQLQTDPTGRVHGRLAVFLAMRDTLARQISVYGGDHPDIGAIFDYRARDVLAVLSGDDDRQILREWLSITALRAGGREREARAAERALLREAEANAAQAARLVLNIGPQRDTQIFGPQPDTDVLNLAQDLSQASLHVRLAILPPSDPALLRYIEEHNHILMLRNHDRSAAEHYELAAQIAREQFGPDDPRTIAYEVRQLDRYARSYREETFHWRAIARVEADPALGDELLNEVLEGLFLSLLRQANFDKALTIAGRLLERFSARGDTGRTQLEAIAWHLNHSPFSRYQHTSNQEIRREFFPGDLGRARTLARQLIERNAPIYDMGFEPDFQLMEVVIGVLLHDGFASEAEAIARRYLEWGAGNRLLEVEASRLLSAALEVQSRWAEAEPPLRRAIELNDGSDLHARQLAEQLGNLLTNQNRLDEAVTVFAELMQPGEEALRLVLEEIAAYEEADAAEGYSQDTSDEERPLREEEALMEPRSHLANLLDRLGRTVEADPLHRAAVETAHAEYRSLYRSHLERGEMLVGLETRADEYTDNQRRLLLAATTMLVPFEADTASTTLLVLARHAASLRLQGHADEADALLAQITGRIGEYWADRPAGAADTLKAVSEPFVQLRQIDIAERLLRERLRLAETATADGADQSRLIIALLELGTVIGAQGRLTEQDTLLSRAASLIEDNETSRASNEALLALLAANLADRGRYGEAETAMRRARDSVSRRQGEDQPNTLGLDEILASYIAVQGRFAEAEQAYLSIIERYDVSLGQANPRTIQVLGQLGVLLQQQRRWEEAQAILERSISMAMTAQGADALLAADQSLSLATGLIHLHRYDEALSAARRVMEVYQAIHGPDHPNLAYASNVEAVALLRLARPAEAEIAYRRALAINEAASGNSHPSTATSLWTLGVFLSEQARHEEALLALERALEINETVLPAGHQHIEQPSRALAAIFLDHLNRPDEALSRVRNASAAVLTRADRLQADTATRDLAATEMRRAQNTFALHALAARRATSAAPGTTPCIVGSAGHECLLAESYWAAQWAIQTAAGEALSQVSARFASGEDALAEAVSEREGLLQRLRTTERDLYEAFGESSGELRVARTGNVRAEMTRLQSLISGIDARLAADFPEYAELANPQPLSVEETQAMLREDEAVVVLLVGDTASIVYFIDSGGIDWAEIPVTSAQLATDVSALRNGLDPISAEDGRAPWNAIDVAATAGSQTLRFDRARAYALYRLLFAPFEARMEGLSHLYVVPSGALTSIPLGVLVTAPPQGDDTDTNALRETSWLARSYAMTVLPAPSSLRALSRFGPSRAQRAFLGIGDPCIGRLAGQCDTAAPLADADGPRGSGGGFSGLRAGEVPGGGAFVVNADDVRRLSALPETGPELFALARALGSSHPDDVMVRARATETQLRTDPGLADRRVIAFATHGLIADEIPTLVEPALVLTPPIEATADDDGLLTASEIARYLRLDADWVILSACNTAAPDGVGAESLSGLARAFFYAGARSLLVSHWVVRDDAARLITTRAISALQDAPEIGRAEALRHSLTVMMDDPDYAHPSIWAPFVLVGENRPVN